MFSRFNYYDVRAIREQNLPRSSTSIFAGPSAMLVLPGNFQCVVIVFFQRTPPCRPNKRVPSARIGRPTRVRSFQIRRRPIPVSQPDRMNETQRQCMLNPVRW